MPSDDLNDCEGHRSVEKSLMPRSCSGMIPKLIDPKGTDATRLGKEDASPLDFPSEHGCFVTFSFTLIETAVFQESCSPYIDRWTLQNLPLWQ